MKRALLSGAWLAGAWACLGLAGAVAGTYSWNGGTTSGGSTNPGDFNSNWWKVGTTLSQTPGAGDVAEVWANPLKSSGGTSSNEYLGFNLSAGFGLAPDGSGNYVQQIGTLQFAPLRGALWIGVDQGPASGAGNAVLVLNGTTVGGLANVVMDMNAVATSASSVVTFQNAVGVSGGGNTFGLRLGTPAVSGQNTFVIRAAAPPVARAGAALNLNVGLGETVAGSAVNFRGGGTDTTAGALIVLGGVDTYTGGTVLGAASASPAAEDGVVVEAKSALPATGDVTVNAGSTLWLSGQPGLQFGSAGQTLFLNGMGTASNANLFSGATGALVSDAQPSTASSPVAFVGAIELDSDSAVAVMATGILAGSGTLALTGPIHGVGALVKNGGGRLQLSGTNDYTGGTRIAAGTLEAASASALGGAAGPVQVQNGGSLQVDAGIRLAQAQVGLSAGGTYVKTFAAGESLGNFQGVRSDGGTAAGIAAGQAGAAESAFATFGANIHGGTVVGDVLTLSGLGGEACALTFQMASAAPISIDEWNSASGLWQAAVQGNAGTAAGAGFFSGTFAGFEAAQGITDANLGDFLGWYGSDGVSGQAWAVVDTNGDFAAMAAAPEPQTWTMMGGGFLLLLLRLRGFGRGLLFRGN